MGRLVGRLVRRTPLSLRWLSLWNLSENWRQLITSISHTACIMCAVELSCLLTKWVEITWITRTSHLDEINKPYIPTDSQVRNTYRNDQHQVYCIQVTHRLCLVRTETLPVHLSAGHWAALLHHQHGGIKSQVHATQYVLQLIIKVISKGEKVYPICKAQGGNVNGDKWWLYVVYTAKLKAGFVADYYVDCGGVVCPYPVCPQPLVFTWWTWWSPRVWY